jgi:hypothetical protein
VVANSAAVGAESAQRAHLADELNGALVETNDRARRIGRLGIEIEHVLHAGHRYAHIFSRRGLSLFSARRRRVSPERLS